MSGNDNINVAISNLAKDGVSLKSTLIGVLNSKKVSAFIGVPLPKVVSIRGIKANGVISLDLEDAFSSRVFARVNIKNIGVNTYSIVLVNIQGQEGDFISESVMQDIIEYADRIFNAFSFFQVKVHKFYFESIENSCDYIIETSQGRKSFHIDI